MSRATANYGQDLISGILAGQKFKQFQDDAKNTALQRQLLEQQYNHNAIMEPLLMAHQDAATKAEQSRLDGFNIANRLASMTFDDTVAQGKASRSKSESEARVATATEGSKISRADSEARQAKADAGVATLAGLQGLARALQGDHEFTPADVGGLAKLMGIMGSSEADAGVIIPFYKNMLDQNVQKYKDDKNFVASKLAEQSAKTRSEAANALHNEVTAGAGISDLFAQAEPEVTAPLQAKLDAGGQLDSADYAKIAVSSYRRRMATAAKSTDGTTTVTESPMDKTEQTDLGKLLVDLRTQLYAAKRSKKELEAGGAPASPTWLNSDSTDRENEIKQHEATIKELEDQIAEIRSQGKGVEKTTTKEGIVNSPLKYPPEIIAYAKANNLLLKSNPTKEEIAQAIEFVKSAKKGK